MNGYEDAAQEIVDVVSSGGYDYYGLRVMTTVTNDDEALPAPRVGSVLAPSHVWDDGERTGVALSGTCAYELPRGMDGVRAVQQHMTRMGREGYSGEYVVLLGASQAEVGEDYNEIIMHGGVVLAVWRK